MILLLASLALGAPPGGAPRVSTGSVGELRGTLLGGVDAWEDGGGLAGLLRLAAGATTGRSWQLSAGYGTQIEAIAGPTWLDSHLATVRLQRAGRLRPGLELAGSGGLLMDPSWAEVAASPGISFRSGSLGLDAAVGGAVRGGGGSVGTGALVGASMRVGQASSAVGAGVVLRTFDGDLPPWTLDLEVQGSTGSSARASLRAGLSWIAEREGQEEPVAGLAAGGTTIARARLDLRLAVSPGLDLCVEPGVEIGWGTTTYRRGIMLLGLSGRVVVASPEPIAQASGVSFSLRAPGASSVDLLASCADWQPIPLHRGHAGPWEVTVQLPPGECAYVYVVDGSPRVPPEARRVRPDGFGGTNGILVIE